MDSTIAPYPPYVATVLYLQVRAIHFVDTNLRPTKSLFQIIIYNWIPFKPFIHAGFKKIFFNQWPLLGLNITYILCLYNPLFMRVSAF